MIYRITSSMDATLYEDSVTKNTGLDEILEIRKYEEDDLLWASRILTKFNLDNISSSIADGTITSASFYLNMYTTDANEIPLDYSIYGYMVSQSWEMGVGKFSYNPIITDGVSWRYRDTYSGSEWAPGSATGSGGDWYDTPSELQAFSYQKADLQMDVTDIVNEWLTGSYDNNGFILKRSEEDEDSSASLGSIKFYSKESHTIYQPTLEVRWDDSVYVSESLSPIIAGTTLIDDINITMRRMRPKYHLSEKAKFRINPRELYPTKTFATSSVAMTVKYLPTSSYYSVIDTNSGLELVPFDTEHTKISCDANGNYFNLWMDQFEPERYYKILFKVIDDEGYERVFANRYMFEVIN